MRNAYALSQSVAAKAALEKLWRQLGEINPSAAREKLRNVNGYRELEVLARKLSQELRSKEQVA